MAAMLCLEFPESGPEFIICRALRGLRSVAGKGDLLLLLHRHHPFCLLLCVILLLLLLLLLLSPIIILTILATTNVNVSA